MEKEVESEKANFIMQNIKELGMFSYDLEEKREKSLMEQSSRMLGILSCFMAITSFSAIFTVNKDILSKTLFFLMLSLLIGSLILIIFSSWRYKYKTMQDIEGIYENILKDHKSYETSAGFDFQWKYQIQMVHDSKKKINDKRANFICISMVLFLISVFILVISLVWAV